MGIKREIQVWGPFLFLLLLLIGLADYQRPSVRQARLDAKLIAAIHSHDTNAAVEALNAGANPNVRDYYCPLPPFWEWVQNRSAAKVQYSGRHHWEPILTAAMSSDWEGNCQDLNDQIIQALLRRGANVNAADYAGETALSTAVWQGRLDLATDLLNRGATVVNLAALDGAVFRGSVPLARLLLAHGADVNGRNVLGDTPLMDACRFGKTAVARLLLNHGADTSLCSRNGKTALQMAQTSRHPRSALVKLLRQYQAKQAISSRRSRCLS